MRIKDPFDRIVRCNRPSSDDHPLVNGVRRHRVERI